ncbi:MAG: hypothetical protein EBU46_16540, partial [Nitrosomonadaceae bacterium]|nr:hypothetical protein [Nitrosomonadaceae bacterium]
MKHRSRYGAYPPAVAGRRITGMEQGYTRFAYTPDSLLTSEGGLWGNDRIAYAYAQGLRTNLGVGIQVATISRGVFATNDAWSQAYTYDAARRLNATISSAGVFTNAYSLPLNQPNRISYPGGAYVTNVFDVMGRWQETTLRGSTNQLLGYHGYQFNRLNRATNQVRLTSCVFTYQYDNIGQLTNATGKEANGTVRLHEKFSYAYDAAGNLINRSNNASGQRFLVAGNLNEINSTTRAGTYTVSGMVVGATNLTVNGLPATLYSDGSFARDIGLPTTGVNTFTVVATGGGRSVTNWVQAYLPATTSFANDARGNLLNDVGPQLSYDADDRLVSMKVLPTST